ncbi:transposase, partial [Sinomonas sp.]|uniref:transposase n=1 Tax=Sinomonas sp. TaxID=1914986 RepID=UPI002FE19C9A
QNPATRYPDQRYPPRLRSNLLAYFDRPGTSNGPTEALNGRLEHLRGSALGFRDLPNCIARALLETGGFRPRLHPQCDEPD